MKHLLDKNVKYIRAGLTWDSEGKPDCDLDLSAFQLGINGKVRGDDDMIFYNFEQTAENIAFSYSGDSVSGSVGEEPDEMILAAPEKISEEVQRVAFCVTAAEGQSFACANHVFFTVTAPDNPYDKDGTELCCIDLNDRHASASGMVVFQLVRTLRGWEYEAIAEHVQGGLAGLCEKFGVEVEQ